MCKHIFIIYKDSMTMYFIQHTFISISIIISISISISIVVVAVVLLCCCAVVLLCCCYCYCCYFDDASIWFARKKGKITVRN
jgi:hypothetical protein